MLNNELALVLDLEQRLADENDRSVSEYRDRNPEVTQLLSAVLETVLYIYDCDNHDERVDGSTVLQLIRINLGADE